MKNVLGILCVALSACTQAKPPPLAIRGATVVDVGDGSLRPDHTVLVAGQRIVAVGPADKVRIPDGADVIDATGGYLIPGLWDMHVHSVANVAVDRSHGSVAAKDWHFPLFLAHGVTGVRNMNDGTGDVTLELSKRIKRQLAEGDLRGPPRFLTAGPSVDGDPPLASNPVVVRTAAEARAAVEQLASNGADVVKVYENLSRGLLRDHRRGQAQENPRGRPRAVPRHTPGGRPRWPAHRRASGRSRSGLLHSG